MPLLREAAQPGQAIPSWAKNTTLYGQALLADDNVSADAQAARTARDLLAKVAAEPAAGITILVMAGRELVRAHRLLGDRGEALKTAERTVDQLLQFAPQQLRRRDREHRLGSIAGIGAEAAAAALDAGQPERAIELLEQSRGLLLGEIISERDDLTRLRTKDPGLARAFEDLRDRLADFDPRIPMPGDRPGPDERASSLAAARAANRREASTQWAPLLARIREIDPGFLTTPQIGELARQARRGPIVMVTSTKNRGDALIVTSDPQQPVRHVRLADGTDAAARAHIDAVFHAFGEAKRVGKTDPADAAVAELLKWTWSDIAEPVLNTLQAEGLLSAARGQRWPRLWWCPVGALAQIPLHAAGLYTDTKRRESVLDWAVSSYIPTIRALDNARRFPEPSVADENKSLIVGVGVTLQESGRPSMPELPDVDKEVQRLKKIMPGAQILSGKDATVAKVLTELNHYPVAHFACHCVTDYYDPGNSRLELYDNAQPGLTVAEISRLPLTDARLAYLSACETASTAPVFSDEALHATGAFLLAGYRDIIGTLWEVWDSSSSDIAELVYRRLTSNGDHPPQTHLSAIALHEAIRASSLRAPHRSSHWAAHIHVGG